MLGETSSSLSGIDAAPFPLCAAGHGLCGAEKRHGLSFPLFASDRELQGQREEVEVLFTSLSVLHSHYEANCVKTSSSQDSVYLAFFCCARQEGRMCKCKKNARYAKPCLQIGWILFRTTMAQRTSLSSTRKEDFQEQYF